MKSKLVETFITFFQYLHYELMGDRYISDIPSSITFESKIDQKNQTVLVSSSEYPGLFTIFPLSNTKKAVDLVNDAIFTYFDVPRYIAKKSPNLFFPISDHLGKEITYQQGLATA